MVNGARLFQPGLEREAYRAFRLIWARQSWRLSNSLYSKLNCLRYSIPKNPQCAGYVGPILWDGVPGRRG